jgi:hypothetical protein
MPKTLTRSELVSTRIDRQIEVQRKVANAGGKILSKIQRLGISAFGAVARFFNLDFSSLWDTIVQGYFTLKYFDWNSSDKEIEQMIEANNKAIVTRAAESLGEQLGIGVVRLANFFLGKAAKAAGSIKVPVLAARVGLALAEEQNDEAMAAVRSLLGAASQAMVSNAFLSSILYLRRNELFGQKSITDDNLPTGSIAEKIDSQIEKLPEFWRQPAEAFIDGFEDGIVSAGYVVAFTIDDHISALQFAQQEKGPMRRIEIVPDPDDPDEVIEISARQGDMSAVIPQVLATHEQLREKDIGQFFGEPIDDRTKPKRSTRFLKISYNSRPRPPWTVKGKESIRAEITISDARPGIGRADLLNLPKYTRGPVYCHQRLENGRNVSVWASSEGEGRRLLTTLVEKLSTAKLMEGTFRASTGDRSGPRHIDRVPMHPVRASLLDYERITEKGEASGRSAQNFQLFSRTKAKDK